MTFTSPWWLLLLVPVLLLVVAYLVRLRRRSRYAVRFAALPMLERLVPKQPGWRRHVPAAALVAAFTVLGLAAAGPQVSAQVPREQATVIVAVDVSPSMGATDVQPNRLEAATTAAAAFIRSLPEEFNVGVIAFSGTATVIAAPTTDHESAALSLGSVRLSNSTAIGEAVFTALDQVAVHARLAGQESVPARIVLLSDGSNTSGRTTGAAAIAATEAGVPVSTIAYGTDEGEITTQGSRVGTPVDRATLAALAESSGGIPYTAESSDQLSQVYADIGSSIGYRTEQVDLTRYAVAVALGTGLLAAAFSMRWFARMP
ncbi:VWA domain-containing protein [Nakamurella sp. YIM 132087]|uniref:VWA domain-containing protein n=1 Tax=Nakamurella alba TaxID=2665158 RepID=A0A7K1FIY0_9ACTN|nr:VWA domain-containing protein [Nakamurella alba]MTD13233.1 VWA domain-containing protein [Nakamurella alba]